MNVFDPMNPVRFILNSKIPTVLDRSKNGYGLAQGMADGPLPQLLGGTTKPPATQTFDPIVTPSGVRTIGRIVTPPASGVQQLGLSQPTASGVQSTGRGLVYASSGVQQLGRYVYHPEAGCRPEVPA